MHSSSRSKLIKDRLFAEEPPDIPILETADLPDEDDWTLMDSMRSDRDDDASDIESAPGKATKLTILSGEFE